MQMLPLELPIDLIEAAHLDDGDLSREAAKLLALELFRENRVSLGRAAELSGTPLAAFMDFAAQHEVSPIRYGQPELEEDQVALAELGL
jgi:predicted HTH domain antitoxin